MRYTINGINSSAIIERAKLIHVALMSVKCPMGMLFKRFKAGTVIKIGSLNGMV